MQNTFTGMFSNLSYLQVPRIKIASNITNNYTYYWLSISSRIVALSICDLEFKLRVFDLEDLDTLLEELLNPENVDNSNCFTRVPVDMSVLYTSLSGYPKIGVFLAVSAFIETYLVQDESAEQID